MAKILNLSQLLMYQKKDLAAVIEKICRTIDKELNQNSDLPNVEKHHWKDYEVIVQTIFIVIDEYIQNYVRLMTQEIH